MSKEFGIYPEDCTPRCWWGARAIITSRKSGNSYIHDLDILWDRQSYDGEKSDELISWINDTAIPSIRKMIVKHKTSNISFNSENGRFHCEAADRNSGGYLYIGCWEVNHE